MTDDVNKLVEGSKQISAGNEQLQAGYKQLTETGAAEQLTAGADELLKNKDTITNGITALQGKDNANAKPFSTEQPLLRVQRAALTADFLLSARQSASW